MRFLLLAVLSLALVTPALAHRQPEVETIVETVTLDGRDQLQITHRFHAHDALKLLTRAGVERPDLSDPEHQARLALYAREHFELSGDEESRMIGVETIGDQVYVYQLHPVLAEVTGSSILAEISASWTNRVEVTDAAGERSSLRFDRDHPDVSAE